jgi:general secretion pathway protein K
MRTKCTAGESACPTKSPNMSSGCMVGQCAFNSCAKAFSLPKRSSQSGSALLAVLWLSAALTAIAFSVATTVRGETDRTATAIDQTRAYYLATAGIDRALLYISWGPGPRLPDGRPRYYEPGMPLLRFEFPTGFTAVEIIPETSKLSLNQAQPKELMLLMLAAGTEPERAATIVEAIVDWRTQAPPDVITPFDQYYLGRQPSFRSRHASFEEVEEVLLLRGMTPELFYGAYQRMPDGKLLPVGGLKDMLSPYGTTGAVDINTAAPAVLTAVGVPPDAVAAIVERRARQPFLNPGELAQLGPAAAHVRIGGNSIFTLRSTATVRLPDGKLSDVRRSVAVTVQYQHQRDATKPYETLRWYDNAGTR